MDMSLLTQNYNSIIPKTFVILAVTYGAWNYIQAKRSPLNFIPVIGYSGVLTSYITAFQFVRYGKALVQEGYEKYPDQAFKVASGATRWLVVLSGAKLVNDIRKAPTDVLSMAVAAGEVLQSKYMMGREIDDERYHVATIRTPLTRNLVARFPDVRDEIVESLKDYIPLTKDWTPIHLYGALVHIVCRTTNRFFIGLPLCRHPDYIEVNEKFAMDVAVGGSIINCFPGFLRPLVGRYLTSVPRSVQRLIDYLGPTLEERIKKDRELGFDWPDRPNDLISWLLETATHEYHFTVRDLVIRILSINFAAIHTSSMALAHALYDLAIHPEYAKPMREEIEAVISEDGWTKPAIQRMRRVDSFLKESQRLNPIGNTSMIRKVMKDYTLSDGTVLPAGTDLCVAIGPMNRDERTFPEARTFKGFRFAEMRSGDGELDSIQHQMVSLSVDYITFGHGRNACPGRFFAVTEMKAIFAHILLDYDIQLENRSMERPENIHHKTGIIPNTRAKVMFRKRRVD